MSTNDDELLVLVAYKGDLETVQDLIKNNAKVDSVLEGGLTALLAAAIEGHTEIVKVLIERDVNVNHASNKGYTALLGAAENGHSEAVKILIEHGADVNHANIEGETALILAAQNGHLETVKILNEHGVEVNHAEHDGWTALNIAALNGHSETVKILIEHGADVNYMKNNGGTALIFAAQDGHSKTVKILIEHAAEVNHAKNNGSTALIFAAQYGHSETVKILIEHDAEVNHLNNDGWATLTYASQNGHSETVKILIEHGAEVNHANNNGRTALIQAAQNGHSEIVKILIYHGVEVNHANNNGDTALIFAAQDAHSGTVKILIEHGAEVNHSNNEGGTALIFAAQETVKILIEHGAEVNHSNNEGGTALTLAAQKGHSETVTILIESGAEVNHANNNGDTALIFAALDGHSETVKILIEHGAEVNHAINSGSAALSFAAENGHSETVKLLIEHGAEVNHANNSGNTALTFAVQNGHLETFDILVQNGAWEMTKQKLRIVYLAAIGGFVELVLRIVVQLFQINTNTTIYSYIKDDKDAPASEHSFENELSNFIKNIETCINILKDHKRQIEPFETNEDASLELNIKWIGDYCLDLNRLYKRKEELKDMIKKPSALGVGIDIYAGIVISEVNKEIMKNFKIQEDVLGSGSFGVVKKGYVTKKDDTKEHIAVKCIEIDKHRCNLSILTEETNCLETLRHDNIVAFYGHKLQYDRLGSQRTMLYLVTELCTEDLHEHYIRDGKMNDRNPFGATDLIKSLKHYLTHAVQVLSGIEFVHSKSFIHKDIKLQNILLSTGNQAKICDFGLSAFVQSGVEETRRFMGTDMYSAPEVLDFSMRRYSAKSDIFSLGLALAEMYLGQEYYKFYPFVTKSNKKDILHLLQIGYTPIDKISANSNIEKCVSAILNGCLRQDYESRLSATEAKNELQIILKTLDSDQHKNETFWDKKLKVTASEKVFEMISRAQTSSISYDQSVSSSTCIFSTSIQSF